MPTKKEIRTEMSKAKKLLSKENKKIIDERFGSFEDAFFWMHNADPCNMAIILNDLLYRFENK